MSKPIVFISHIKEEKAIAIALKQLVEFGFLEMMEVFVSSDTTSIELGREWLGEIKKALTHCAIEIVIASPTSVKRSWINFEAGAGWIRDIPVIPLCHSGMNPELLPLPLKALQAATATDETELRNVLPVLARSLRSKVPEIDFSKFIEEVRQFEVLSQQSAALTENTPIALADGLTPHEVAAIVTIAEETHDPTYAIPVHRIREAMERGGYTGVAVNLALRLLAQKNLIEFKEESENYETYTVVALADDGWRWLNANSHLLTLKKEMQELEMEYVPADTERTSDGKLDTPPEDLPF